MGRVRQCVVHARRANAASRKGVALALSMLNQQVMQPMDAGTAAELRHALERGEGGSRQGELGLVLIINDRG